MVYKHFYLIIIILFSLFSISNIAKDNDLFVLKTEDNLSMVLDKYGYLRKICIDNYTLMEDSKDIFMYREYGTNYTYINLIENPGFEIDRDGNGFPDEWFLKKIKGDISGYNVKIDNEEHIEGNYSLRISTNSTISLNIYALYTTVNVEECTEYFISIYVKSLFGYMEIRKTLSIQIKVRWFKSNGDIIYDENILTPRGNMFRWKKFTNKTYSPPNSVKAVIGIIIVDNKLSKQYANIFNETIWIDDIQFYKTPPEFKYKSPHGYLKRKGDMIIQNITSNNLRFNIKYKVKKYFIQIECELFNLVNMERSVEVVFKLPFNAIGWKWWDDIRNFRIISDKKIYRNIVNCDDEGFLPISLYPLAAIENDRIGLSIAIPLDQPRIYEIYYDSIEKYFGIKYYLGLSPYTYMPNYANSTIIIYRFNPKYGFRSSLKRYYNFYPKYFSSRINFNKTINIRWNLSDYGIYGLQGHFQYDSIARKGKQYSDLNLTLLQYILPFEFEPRTYKNIDEKPLNYSEVIDMIYYLAERNGYIGLKAKAATNTLVQDINNDICFSQYLKGPNYRPNEWVPRIPLNTNPEISGFNMYDYTILILQQAFNNTLKYGYMIDGVELDSFMARSNHIDMNKTRFRFTAHPLTFSFNNFQPGVHLIISDFEYLEKLRKYLDNIDNKMILSGNFVAEGYVNFGIIYLDIVPFEANMISKFNWGDREFNYRRIMAFQKPVLISYTRIDSELNFEEFLEKYLNEALFYGFYPNFHSEIYEEYSDLLNKYRDKIRQVINIINNLTLAGWQPETFTYVENNNVWIERYGDKEIFLTIKNTREDKIETIIKVYLDKLGLNENIDVDLIYGDAEIINSYVDNGVLNIRLNISGLKTIVLRLKEKGEAKVDLQIDSIKIFNEDIYENDIVKIQVLIRVTGIQKTLVRIIFKIDEKILKEESIEINNAVTKNFIWKAERGYHKLEVMVKSSENLTEENLDNNFKEIEIYVKSKFKYPFIYFMVVVIIAIFLSGYFIYRKLKAHQF